MHYMYMYTMVKLPLSSPHFNHGTMVPLYLIVHARFFLFCIFTIYIHAFFESNISISNVRLKLVKNQAKAKHHPGVEPLLFENDSLFSSLLSSKNNR